MRILLLALATTAALIPVAAAPAAAADEHRLTCFPLAPVDIRYDNTWGAARSGGRRHQGTDIMVPKQTVVIAVADAVVETMDTAAGAGYYVRLVHQGGWETWYMHLDNDSPGSDDGRAGAEAAFADGLEVGDSVAAGQVIGYVGDSGNAEWTGSHLHFELHIAGAPTNPYLPLVEAEDRIDLLRQLTEPTVPPEVAGEHAATEDDISFDTTEQFETVAPVDTGDRPDAACLEPTLHPAPAATVTAEESVAEEPAAEEPTPAIR